MPIITIICAMDEGRGIGIDGKLPWNLPDDLQHFKKLTTGHAVIMGRKTFDSILNYRGAPLPERTNIVVTRNESYSAPQALIATSLKGAIEMAKQYEKETIFIIGGGQIFNSAIEFASRLNITVVKGKYRADTFFPEINGKIWKEIAREDHGNFAFVTYERMGTAPQ